MFTEDDLIYAYTRVQAIEDDMLVDVSATAREAGFKIRTALTRGAWERAVALPEDYHGEQDESGRLWDVLFVAVNAIRRSSGSSLLTFSVSVRDPHTNRQSLVHLKAICGPGDAGEPVITVLLPDED